MKGGGAVLNNSSEEKNRVIQEYVPGKQISVAHIISNPDKELCEKLGIASEGHLAIGVLNMSPSEASVIAADIALKVSNVEIGYIDRFSGSVTLIGSISSVTVAVENVIKVLKNVLEFNDAEISKN